MHKRAAKMQQNNWSQQLPYVMMAYRSSVHESTGYTPQFLVHGRETYLWISCSPAQNPIIQLMSMSLSIRENKLFSEHLRWSATILTRISDGVTPYIIRRYMAPPTETDKKCFYIRQWYPLARVPSFLAHGVALTLY